MVGAGLEVKLDTICAMPTSDQPPGRPARTDPRVVGLDLGKARVGVAISDELGLLAHERGTLDGRSRKQLLAQLQELARKEGVDRFVVGWPLSMSGGRGGAAERAARFAQQLADATGCEVELLDERLTTVQAERELREAGVRRSRVGRRVDGRAAALVLQTWLDSRASRGGD